MSLQYNNPFSKTSVLRLHCGNPFAPIQSLFAGVLQAKPVLARAAGSFCKLTSERALNRPRSPEVRKPLVYFWYFSYTRKVRKTFLSQGASRFCKPRPSPPQPQLRTATIKTFLWKLRGFANLEAAHTNNKFAQTKLNPFSNLRRTKTCRRQLLCVRAYFLLAQKVLQKSPPCREFAAFGSFFTGERSPDIPSACSLCACGKPWKNTVHSQILPKRPLL